MSNTPRTDARERSTLTPNFSKAVAESIAWEWARELELELASMTDKQNAWETELSKVMPPDFKDWWKNSKSEWPIVARMVIESLHEREKLYTASL